MLDVRAVPLRRSRASIDSPSGSQLWSRTWTNSLSRQYGTAVCVDAAGNIYVAGTAYTSATGIQYQWVILKYSPDGTLQAGFPITYNNLGDETIPDIPYDIGVDTSGNIIVAGQIGVGTGNIDWEETFLALKRQGFDGYYAVDLEHVPDLEQRFVDAKAFLEGYAGRLGL